MKKLVFSFTLLACLFIIGFLVLKGYGYTWTGFSAHKLPDGELVSAKTLWDWQDLLIVPIVLAVGAFLLDGSRKRSDRSVESDRQKQQTLEEYLSYISTLLLEHNLTTKNSSGPARELVRTRTLTALRLLDGKRKSQLLQFLYEAGLINTDPIIQLNGANLTSANLDEATLDGAELRGVYFFRATIRHAKLVGADLRGSDFSEVDFTDTDLSDCRLAQAILLRANLKTAVLKNADLRDVDLNNTKLTSEQRSFLISNEN